MMSGRRRKAEAHLCVKFRPLGDELVHLRVELPIVAPELCDVRYEQHSKQQGEFPRLCAGSPGKGSRAGDSGGPLFTRDPQSGGFVLRGIVSGGRPGYPGGYVNLADPDLWE